jgi:hypothetical protein
MYLPLLLLLLPASTIKLTLGLCWRSRAWRFYAATSACVAALRSAGHGRDRGAIAIQRRARGIKGRVEAARQRHLLLRHFYAAHIQVRGPYV